ncbi:MAG: porin family protein [Sulfurovum sp.]|nr:porin family protein [Sulfurovum sp.]
MKRILISTILASVLSVSSLSAFDEQKKGFLLSYGAGASFIDTKVKTGKVGTDGSTFGLATSFKVGYGFTNQFALYYMNDISWFESENDPYGHTHSSGFSGISGSYYITESSPIYVTAGVGIGTFSNFSELKVETGESYLLGAGYEFSPHVQVEATYHSNTIEEKNVDLSTDALKITVNYMLY